MMNPALIQLITFFHNALLISGIAKKVLKVMSLDTIDESSMTDTSDVFSVQSWKDYWLMLPDNMT